jgi:hypothetical protein
METIEIRQNKKALVPMLVILILALLGMTYYTFFPGKFDNNSTMKLVSGFLTALLIYGIYIPTRKLIKNEPVLVFRNNELEINQKGKPISISWPQIKRWKIEKDDDGSTHYLIIETTETHHKLNISWLDKRPGEIEGLLQRYINR